MTAVFGFNDLTISLARRSLDAADNESRHRSSAKGVIFSLLIHRPAYTTAGNQSPRPSSLSPVNRRGLFLEQGFQQTGTDYENKVSPPDQSQN